MHNGMMIDATAARIFETTVQRAHACGVTAEDAATAGSQR
jgi:hypothetical protein